MRLIASAESAPTKSVSSPAAAACGNPVTGASM
jgi:hypothetical protein